MRPGVPGRPGPLPLPDGEVTVEQLKRLVEIQTEIVKRAELVERAKKNRHAVAWRLIAAPRRLLTFLSQLR